MAVSRFLSTPSVVLRLQGGPDNKVDRLLYLRGTALGWTVYIVECGDGTLYTGITIDLPRRLQAHANGKGAKYTRGRGPFSVVYTESHPTKSEALQREAHIKQLDTRVKRALSSTPHQRG